MRLLKGFLAGITVMIAGSANAQFKKGDRMVGTSIASALYNSGSADISFSQVRGYTAKTSSYYIRLEPTMGWFISEKTAIGASLNINPTGQKNSYEDLGTTFQEDKANNFNIGLGAFVRNYFGTSNFMPFAQFGFNGGISSGTTEGFKYYSGTPAYRVSYDGKSSGGGFANASLQFGLTKMLGENAGLDIYLGYNYSYSKNSFKTTTLTVDAPYTGMPTRAENDPTTKSTNHGVIFGVGYQIFLRGGK